MIFVSNNITKKQDSNKPQMLVSLSHQAQLWLHGSTLIVTTSSPWCQQPPAFWSVEDQSTEYAPTWDLPVVLQVRTSSQSSQTNAFSITTQTKMAKIDYCLIFHNDGKVLTIKWPKTTSNHWWEPQNVIQIVCDSVCMNSCGSHSAKQSSSSIKEWQLVILHDNQYMHVLTQHIACWASCHLKRNISGSKWRK
jgi:hypothetical protein